MKNVLGNFKYLILYVLASKFTKIVGSDKFE